MDETPELTTRDVLHQVDRRLTSNEEATRTLGAELRREIAALRADMLMQFRWIVGLILVSWLSTMGMMLQILLRMQS